MSLGKDQFIATAANGADRVNPGAVGSAGTDGDPGTDRLDGPPGANGSGGCFSPSSQSRGETSALPGWSARIQFARGTGGPDAAPLRWTGAMGVALRLPWIRFGRGRPRDDSNRREGIFLFFMLS